MSDIEPKPIEPTAVDDVRRVREKIARQHGGDLHQHVQETNHIAAGLRAKLNVRVVPAPKPNARRSGTQQ
jgi:hypothetical protein